MKKSILIEIAFWLSVLIFLAAIIFGFAEHTELKGDDQTKNNLAQQYVTALRLFAADHGGEYPYPGFISKPVCVGSDNPSGQCQGDALENVPLEASLATYLEGTLNGTPSDPQPLYIHGQNYGGIGYVCYAADYSDPTNVVCKTYGLFWNTHYKSTCISGASSGPADSCSYTGS